MNNWQLFWRRIGAFLWLHTPIRTYGELVLGAVNMAERDTPRRNLRHAAQNKS